MDEFLRITSPPFTLSLRLFMEALFRSNSIVSKDGDSHSEEMSSSSASGVDREAYHSFFGSHSIQETLEVIRVVFPILIRDRDAAVSLKLDRIF